MWPANQMMLSRKLPNSVTTSHERTKHMLSKFGNVMCPIETMPRYLKKSFGWRSNPHTESGDVKAM